MTNSIIGDNFLAHDAAKQRNADAPGGARPSPDKPRSGTPRPDDHADIGRAHQRLSQEVRDAAQATVASMSEARALVSQLRTQIGDDPQAAMKAHAGLNDNSFEAAMARPTA